jgi:hypothetical protein
LFSVIFNHVTAMQQMNTGGNSKAAFLPGLVADVRVTTLNGVIRGVA